MGVSRAPSAWQGVLEDFLVHVRDERSLSQHTVRAYRSDLLSLFDHAQRACLRDIAELDVRLVRSWLATMERRICSKSYSLIGGLIASLS